MTIRPAIGSQSLTTNATIIIEGLEEEEEMDVGRDTTTATTATVSRIRIRVEGVVAAAITRIDSDATFPMVSSGIEAKGIKGSANHVLHRNRSTLTRTTDSITATILSSLSGASRRRRLPSNSRSTCFRSHSPRKQILRRECAMQTSFRCSRNWTNMAGKTSALQLSRGSHVTKNKEAGSNSSPRTRPASHSS